MKHDERLVEAMCEAHWRFEGGGSLAWQNIDEDSRECRRTAMRAALAVVEAHAAELGERLEQAAQESDR